MKQALIIVIVVVLLGIFFLFPFLPSNSVYMTKSQKEQSKIFCESHGCGLISYYTPFMFLKDSIQNALLPKESLKVKSSGSRPEVPSPKNSYNN